MQARLLKAQRSRDEGKVKDLKAKIAELTEDVNEEEIDGQTLKQLEEEKRIVEKLNKLSKFMFLECGPPGS